MFLIGLNEPDGDVLRDLQGFRDCTTLGNQPRQILTGREEPALWKGLNMNAEKYFPHTLISQRAVVSLWNKRWPVANDGSR